MSIPSFTSHGFRSHSRPWPLIVLCSSLFGLFYLLFGSENFIYADDSLRFAIYVDSAPTILVHHLVIAILYQVEKGLNPFGEGIGGTILFLRFYVAASSLLALVMVGLMTLRWFRSVAAALLAISTVALSYGFWSYSIVTDFYVPAVAFVLAAVYLADRSYDARHPRVLLLLASVSVLIASLNHQSHALVVVPIALVLWRARRTELTASNRLSRALLFFGTTGLLGLVCFYVASHLSDNADFIQFVRGYSAYFMMTPYDRLQPLTPVYAAIGVVRTVLFPEVLLGIDAVFELAHGAFPLKVLIDDRYLVREFPMALVASIALLGATFSVLLMIGIVRTIRLARRHGMPHPGYWMLLVWGILQMLFFAWWEPLSNEFWIWLLPTLAVLISGPLFVNGSIRSRRLQAAAVVLLLLANLPVVSLYWSAENCIYWINKSYASAIGPNDLVLTMNFYQTSSMDRIRLQNIARFEMFAGAMSSGEPELPAALDDVRRRGGSVFLDPMLAMPDETELAMRKYYTRRPAAIDENELKLLERYCRERSIPLYAIERRGQGEVPFRRWNFDGYLQWISPDTGRAQLNAMQISAGGRGR